jgi:hypothetical protein
MPNNVDESMTDNLESDSWTPPNRIKKTRFSLARLPKTQRFAGSKRDIKVIFPDGLIGWVSIGDIKPFKLYPRSMPAQNLLDPWAPN